MEKSTIEIIIQTRERIFARRSADEVQSLCPTCQTGTVFIEPGRAALQTGTSVRRIFRRIENGTIHFVETPEGLVLVCQQSLTSHEIEHRQIHIKGTKNCR